MGGPQIGSFGVHGLEVVSTMGFFGESSDSPTEEVLGGCVAGVLGAEHLEDVAAFAKSGETVKSLCFAKGRLLRGVRKEDSDVSIDKSLVERPGLEMGHGAIQYEDLALFISRRATKSLGVSGPTG